MLKPSSRCLSMPVGDVSVLGFLVGFEDSNGTVQHILILPTYDGALTRVSRVSETIRLSRRANRDG